MPNGATSSADAMEYWSKKICEIAPDYSSPIVVYCAGGNRGAVAADNFQKWGTKMCFR
jgi:rhodanese-related sulfurtransferase